jgi:dGTP triphosphohydrolase
MAAPKSGDFSFIKDAMARQVYEDAWKTINKIPNAHEHIRTRPSSQSWMFSSNEQDLHIMKSLSMYEYHSGCSLALTMREMEAIVKYGWTEWVNNNLVQ